MLTWIIVFSVVGLICYSISEEIIRNNERKFREDPLGEYRKMMEAQRAQQCDCDDGLMVNKLIYDPIYSGLSGNIYHIDHIDHDDWLDNGS